MSKHPLEGKRRDLTEVWPEDLIIVGHDDDSGWEHPLYDPRAKDPTDWSLMASIAEYGCAHTPITVIKDGFREDGKPRMLVKVGRGRVKACRDLNKTRRNMGLPPQFKVMCQYDAKCSEKQIQAHQVSENEQRRPDTLENRIAKMERYMQCGATVKEMAIHFRRTETQIRRWIKFLGVCKEWQLAVYTGGSSLVDTLRILSDEEGRLLPHNQQLELFVKHERACRSAPTGQKRRKLTGALNPGRPRGPTRKTVERVFDAAKQDRVKLHPEFLRALEFVTGRLTAEELGIADIIKSKSPKKEGASEKKANQP